METWKERTGLLVGERMLQRFASATVAVIGVGGVGGYAAEMLVRAGVGNLIILDSDSVSETNKNRQLLALDSTVGRAKCEVLSERLHDINPALNLVVIKQYLEAPVKKEIPTSDTLCPPRNDVDNVDDYTSFRGAKRRGNLTDSSVAGEAGSLRMTKINDARQLLGQYHIDFLIDAIDTLSPKLGLIKYCIDSGIPLVSSMGAGAKYDVTKVRITDISKSFNCPLAYMVRKKLRHMGISKGFKVVFSEELPDPDAMVLSEERNHKSQVGTISYMPAVFGCACAQVAIRHLMENC